jgi:hypothetical protein
LARDRVAKHKVARRESFIVVTVMDVWFWLGCEVEV